MKALAFIIAMALFGGRNQQAVVLPESVRQAAETQELRPLKLLHCTDLHGSKEHLARIVAYKQAHPELDDAIHTGDGVSCYTDDENIFEAVPGGRGILNIIGNHDAWKGHLVWSQTMRPYDALKGDTYMQFFIGPDAKNPTIAGWNVTQPEGVNDPQSPDYQGCYYYKDYPQSEARLVVVDCMHYDEAHDAWLSRTLTQAREKGYAVIAATHYPAQTGLTPYGEGLTPKGEDYPDDMNPGERQLNATPELAFIRVDEFIDAGGRFVCWLSGHEHNDYYGKVKGHERQLQVLLDKSGAMDKYMLDKDRSGENADAFNIVTFYPSDGTYTLERVGCAEGLRGERVFRGSAVSL